MEKAQRLVGAQNVATAISLVRYPPHLQPIMDYVFGGLLVCPTLDIARKVAFHPGIERRTVTFDGDVFDPQSRVLQPLLRTFFLLHLTLELQTPRGYADRLILDEFFLARIKCCG
ncbi:unnamed protein product [Dibothriocephalus latus]|uniref:SMC hinge domain-containing protein n=1 Tax=Dibothriocephalus latus TaxID=60516 RepID=A0A3P7NR86_DIBLA|nr:unnamed protein product [Dibothriocephalus latus]